jgi:hypothetical protein
MDGSQNDKHAKGDAEGSAEGIRRAQCETAAANRAHGGIHPEARFAFLAGSARILPSQRDAMRQSARESEDRSQGEPETGSKDRPIGDGARQGSQRPMLAAQQIVSQIERSQYVQRTADDADQSEGVPVHS